MKSTGKKSKRVSKSSLIGFILILSLTIVLAYFGIFKIIVEYFKDYGIFGIFLTGIFYGYSFAAFPASVMFIYLSKSYNPVLIALIGSFGVLTENFIVFIFFKKQLNQSLEEISKNLGLKFFSKIKKSSKWALTTIALIVFLTPLPNEIAIYLLSLEELNPKLFIIFSFFASFIGILVIATIGSLF